MCFVLIAEEFDCPYCGPTEVYHRSISVRKMSTTMELKQTRPVFLRDDNPQLIRSIMEECNCEKNVFWAWISQFEDPNNFEPYAHLCYKCINRDLPEDFKCEFASKKAVEEALHGERDLELDAAMTQELQRYLNDEIGMWDNLEACYRNNDYFQKIERIVRVRLDVDVDWLEDSLKYALALKDIAEWDSARVSVERLLNEVNEQLFPEILENLASLPTVYDPDATESDTDCESENENPEHTSLDAETTAFFSGHSDGREQ